MSYEPSKEMKEKLSGMVALSFLSDNDIAADLPENFFVLESILKKLQKKNFVMEDMVDYNHVYKISAEGQSSLSKFMARFDEYKAVYDIYCSVDLYADDDEDRFAFEQMYNIEDDDLWSEHVNDDKWFDLRVLVAEFKKLDPFEIVFMSQLESFDFEDPEWAIDLVTGDTWAEITEICDNAVKEDELPEGALVDLIDEGNDALKSLHQQKRDIEADEEEIDPDEYDEGGDLVTTTTTTEVVEYEEEDDWGYDLYYDPYYVSPLWYDPYWY
jgi:hypothetical protein